MIDEYKLLNNLRSRKRGSLERVIDLYTPYVSVIVYNIIGGVMAKEDVEEAVADTFVALWKNAWRIEADKGGIRAYLGAVARNCARKKLRGVRVCDELDENIVCDQSEPSEYVEVMEEQKLLLELIRGLGEPDSEIFLRHYWYNEGVSRISAVTGICSSTITTKLHRGRRKLKEIIEKEKCI